MEKNLKIEVQNGPSEFALLGFDLSDVEGRVEHLKATKSNNLLRVIEDIFDYLRYNIRKDPNRTEQEVDLFEEVQEKLVYILDDRSIDLEEMRVY